MQQAELEALVKRITQQVLAAQRRPTPESLQALIIETPKTKGQWRQAAPALAQHYQVQTVVADAEGQCRDQGTLDAALAALGPKDKLILTSMSLAERAQASQGLVCGLTTACAGFAFAHGLPIYLVEPLATHLAPDANRAYAAMFATYQRQLQAFGLTTCRWADLLPQATSAVVTAADVANLPAGAVYTVALGTVVTPLAKERLAAQNTRLVYAPS